MPHVTDPLTLPDPAVVARCKNMTDALIQCQSVSGLEDKQLCGKEPGDIIGDPATWSRIKGGSAHFPHDRLPDFMRRCGNAWPLAYLADDLGYMLRPKETELMRQLREKEEQIDQLRQELAHQARLLAEFKDLLIARDAQRAHSPAFH